MGTRWMLLPVFQDSVTDSLRNSFCSFIAQAAMAPSLSPASTVVGLLRRSRLQCVNVVQLTCTGDDLQERTVRKAPQVCSGPLDLPADFDSPLRSFPFKTGVVTF